MSDEHRPIHRLIAAQRGRAMTRRLSARLCVRVCVCLLPGTRRHTLPSLFSHTDSHTEHRSEPLHRSSPATNYNSSCRLATGNNINSLGPIGGSSSLRSCRLYGLPPHGAPTAEDRRTQYSLTGCCCCCCCKWSCRLRLAHITNAHPILLRPRRTDVNQSSDNMLVESAC